MGIFISYCKKCNHSITWFVGVKNYGIKCKNCGTQNTYDDLILSDDPEYWERQFFINRILKIYKIKNKK